MIPRGVPYLAPAGRSLDELERFTTAEHAATLRADEIRRRFDPPVRVAGPVPEFLENSLPDLARPRTSSFH